MNTAYRQYILNQAQRAKALLNLYMSLLQGDILWNGTPDYKAKITQTEIDGNQAFFDAGLTVQNLADAQYTLSLVEGQIAAQFPALQILASLT